MRDTEVRTGEPPADHAEVIRRFEEAWWGPGRPCLEGYLPHSRPADAGLLLELVHVELDFRLRRGEAARVEEYLERYPELGRDSAALLDLIVAERALRRYWESDPAPEEYLRRFPQHAALLGDETAASGRPITPRRAGGPAERLDVPGYETLHVLGRGGMGIVYAARQAALGRVVALKSLLPGYEEEDIDRFRHEAEAIARLDHPGIVPVYEVGECGGRPFFSMKLYPGGSLADRVSGPSADPRADASLVEAVALAVHHAHQRGVLHRDLKPSNILLDEDGQPHVADFGLAKRFDPSAGATFASGVVGTPSYSAPEQARGNQAVTTATDVYGLGAVLYELLTGKPPFLAETVLATLAEVVDRPPRPPRLANPRVPADLETVCLKCLEKEPARRYQGARELADDLGRWRRGEPISGRPVGRLERWQRWWRRNPREAAIAALALALLLLAAGGAWWLDRRQASHREELARQEARQQAEQELLQEPARLRVRDALAQQRSLRQRFLWDEAKAVLGRAEQEAYDLGLEELLARVREARRELALAARLDQIQLDAATINERSGLSKAEAAKGYREAFRAHGLDFEAGDVADLTRRVRDSAIREELVTALDTWAEIDRPLLPRLLAVARGADPGPWKDRLRAPGLAKEREAIKAQLATVDMSQLTPTLLIRLGRLLSAHEESLDLLRRAQRRYPGDFWLNFRLGEVLYWKGRKEEAIGYLQAAVAVRPQRGVIHNNLAVALRETGRLDEAIASFEEALQRDPLLHQARNNLGVALADKGRLDEAVTAYRQVIHVKKDYAAAYINLGIALEELGRLDEAIAAHRQALGLQPNSPLAHVNLAAALRNTGRLAEALANFRRADELGKKTSNWRHPSATWVRDCQRLVELEGKLPAVLKGEAAPRDADERLDFAKLCRCKGLHATAARLFAEAFATGAGGTAGPSRSDRYAAARSAALTAAGRATDVEDLDDARRAELRRQALGWLRANLEDLELKFEKEGVKAKPALAESLPKWQRSLDLTGVRAEEALAGLPEAEARAWRDFWKAVAALLARESPARG